MINLFYDYSDASRDLHQSLLASGYTHPTVVIEDDGFLPEDINSPLKFLLKRAGSVFKGRPRYFNEIDKPHFWEIKSTALGADVLDKGKRRGCIKFHKNDRKRQVKSVEWFDENGQVRVVDRYNQWGWKFAQTTKDAQGRDAITSYYSSQGTEVLIHNELTGDYLYNEPNGTVKLFKNNYSLTAYYLERSGFNLNGAIINSLGSALFTLINLKKKPTKNILFWQEHIQNGIPDNMLFMLKGNIGQSKVIVQDQQEYQKIISNLSADLKKNVYYLGNIYSFKRENTFQPRALIFTNSDQIECLKQLVENLKQVHFDIAAVTEMSSKLMAFGKYDNVNLYPTVSDKVAAQLLKENDIYLDINYANEILNADRRAFEHNLLLLAFKDTIHSKKYVAEENVFEKGDADSLVEKVNYVLKERSAFNDALNIQRKYAGSETADSYHQIIEK